jgi:hypothetical protein
VIGGISPQNVPFPKKSKTGTNRACFQICAKKAHLDKSSHFAWKRPITEGGEKR